MLYKSLKDTKNTFFPTGWGGLRKSHEEALQYLLMVGVGPVRASVGWRPGSPENGQSLKYMKTYSLKEAKYDVTVKNNGFKSMGLHMFFLRPRDCVPSDSFSDLFRVSKLQVVVFRKLFKQIKRHAD